MAENKREEILAISLKLFVKNGYENTGVEKIARSSGVKKPTLYYYFGSKTGLLQAIIEKHLTLFLTELEEKTDYRKDIVFNLENITRLYFNFAMNSPDFYIFYNTLSVSPVESEKRKIINPYLEKQFFLLNELFRKTEQDHGNMKGRNKHFSISFLGMINSYIYSYFSNQIELDEKNVYESCRQFMYGIFS